jgi:uncharacterized protein YfdQ (DUF2303 family)
MGLFSNPVTLTDGTDDRIFAYRGPLPDLKIRGGDYIESAAAIAAKSLITIKNDIRTSVIRNLVQRTIRLHPAADTETDDLYPVTLNFTVVASELFTEAELQPELNVLLDALAEANVLKNLRSGVV